MCCVWSKRPCQHEAYNKNISFQIYLIRHQLQGKCTLQILLKLESVEKFLSDVRHWSRYQVRTVLSSHVPMFYSSSCHLKMSQPELQDFTSNKEWNLLLQKRKIHMLLNKAGRDFKLWEGLQWKPKSEALKVLNDKIMCSWFRSF